LVWYHRATGKAEPVELPGGPPLGILPDVAYPETKLVLDHGDILLLLTDGVLESKNARGEAFGLSRLTEVMEAAGANGMATLHPILDAVEAFSGGRRDDDLTLVELRWC
jgi:serine phosphatase RsbU (regulator of sigma subunit)